MVPLTGVNRLLVKAGFEQMANHANIGLKALCEVGNIKSMPGPDDAGFVLGPRINAGSRVHKSDLGAQLLASEDAEEAKNIAWLLNDCNIKRRNIQNEMLREAQIEVESKALFENPIIFVANTSWHVGLNGLVAGQLKEKYGKPACVVAFAHGLDGRLEGRGSGRSIKGINIAALFMAAREAGLVVKGGGHAMAGGFTVYEEQLQQLHDFFIARMNEGPLPELVQEEMIDAVAGVRGIKPDFVKMIENNMGPFGQENREPRFVLPNVRIRDASVIGTNHVRCMVEDMDGGGRLKVVAWKAAESALGELLLSPAAKRGIHLKGILKVNSWNGLESAEMHVEDAALAG
jgi:single-stranded-DNA-specific exonuclease